MEKRMKQSNGTTSSSTLFDDNEIEVAEILLELPNLIAESDYRNRRISFNWAVTRRRSVLSSLRSPSPPPIMSSPAIIVRKTEIVSTSPATPLSFTPSESEEKKNSIKLSKKKRKKEVWLGVVAEETQLNGLLKKELETAKFHFLKLKALNLELKARISAEESRGEKVVPCMERNKSMNLKSEPVQLIVKPSMKLEDMENHHQPLIINNQTVRKPTGEDLRYHMWTPLGNNNNNIPDLNVSLEDGDDNHQQFDYRCVLRNSAADYNRAMATEARKKRKQIYKAKNSMAASINIHKPRPAHK